jgi:Domain of unknown function (DUF4082)/Secretion system C-terminal sorting domain/Cohesin domain
MSRFTKSNLIHTFSKSKLIRRAFLPIILALFFSAVSAQTVNVLVTPATNNVAIGQTFNVKIRLQPVAAQEMDGAEVHLDFDNTQIEVTSISEAIGNLLTQSTPVPLDPISTINTNGHIRYGRANTVAPFPNTAFDFVDINFTVLPGATIGSTPLTFTTVFPELTDVSRSAVSVLGTITNGTVNISPACTPPTATIASNGSTTCNAQPFNLLLNAATGTGPWDLTINGTTYNNIAVGGTITTFTPPSLNIFTTTPTPPTNVDASVNLGVRFSSSVDGYIKGIRFFSPNVIDGVYTGSLYADNAGAASSPLATAVFSGVTPDGWQQVLFSTPVEITAGTVYIAAYHTTGINYVSSNGGLLTAVNNGPLTALASAADPDGNGVYAYAATPNTPISGSPLQANYWVDVVFSPKEYTFELTSVVDDAGCTATGAPLQTLTVTSVNCNTLPVTLLNLSATPQDKKITVRWATDGESNNKGFDLLRSTDGINWQTIAFINGAGNSSSVKNYSYVDLNLSPKRYYYRLKQIDFDGKYKISATVSAVIDGKGSFSLSQNFPNPTVGGETTIQFTLAAASKVSLSLYDMHGRLVRVLATGGKDAGTHAIPVNTGSLTSGVYYYKLQAGDFSDVKKMTIQ